MARNRAYVKTKPLLILKGFLETGQAVRERGAGGSMGEECICNGQRRLGA